MLAGELYFGQMDDEYERHANRGNGHCLRAQGMVALQRLSI